MLILSGKMRPGEKNIEWNGAFTVLKQKEIICLFSRQQYSGFKKNPKLGLRLRPHLYPGWCPGSGTPGPESCLELRMSTLGSP